MFELSPSSSHVKERTSGTAEQKPSSLFIPINPVKAFSANEPCCRSLLRKSIKALVRQQPAGGAVAQIAERNCSTCWFNGEITHSGFNTSACRFVYEHEHKYIFSQSVCVCVSTNTKKAFVTARVGQSHPVVLLPVLESQCQSERRADE